VKAQTLRSEREAWVNVCLERAHALEDRLMSAHIEPVSGDPPPPVAKLPGPDDWKKCVTLTKEREEWEKMNEEIERAKPRGLPEGGKLVDVRRVEVSPAYIAQYEAEQLKPPPPPPPPPGMGRVVDSNALFTPSPYHPVNKLAQQGYLLPKDQESVIEELPFSPVRYGTEFITKRQYVVRVNNETKIIPAKTKLSANAHGQWTVGGYFENVYPISHPPWDFAKANFLDSNVIPDEMPWNVPGGPVWSAPSHFMEMRRCPPMTAYGPRGQEIWVRDDLR